MVSDVYKYVQQGDYQLFVPIHLTKTEIGDRILNRVCFLISVFTKACLKSRETTPPCTKKYIIVGNISLSIQLFSRSVGNVSSSHDLFLTIIRTSLGVAGVKHCSVFSESGGCGKS